MTPFELPPANTSGRIVRGACALKRHEGSGRVTREISRPSPRGNALDRRQNFHPLPNLVDSTRRKSLISWQKRAAGWEHGFESRWGHFSNFVTVFRPGFSEHRNVPRTRNA